MKPHLTVTILMRALRWQAQIRYWTQECVNYRNDKHAHQVRDRVVNWTRQSWRAWQAVTEGARRRIAAFMSLDELAAEEAQAAAAASPLVLLAAAAPGLESSAARQVFGAALELFNKVWPVLGLLLCVALLVLVLLTFLSLVDACRRGPGSGWGEAYKGEGGTDE